MSGTENVTKMSSLQNAFSGSLAAVFAALVLCPTELVKCRLQAQRETNPNIKSTPISVCRQMLRTEGISAFTTGMVPTLGIFSLDYLIDHLSKRSSGIFLLFWSLRNGAIYDDRKGKE
jgi:hypothetical protein